MNNKDTFQQSSYLSLGVCLAIVVIVALVYLPTLHGDFLLDDYPLVVDNQSIRQFQPLPWYFVQEDGVSQDRVAGDYHTGYYRPLVSLTYSIDYKLWGLSPKGFRLTNLILHVAVCLMLYFILRAHQTSIVVSFTVVMLFGLHPVNTEAVSWISSRNNILAALFSLASFYFYTAPDSAGGWIDRSISALFFAAALFSKEFGVMLLPILFIYNRFGKRRFASWSGEWLGYLPFVFVLAVYLYLRHQVLGSFSINSDHGLLLRLLTAPFIILYYCRILFFPVGLHNFYVPQPEQIRNPDILMGICGLILVVILILRSPRGSRLRWGAMIFIIGLAPVLNIVPMASPSLVSMRWAYFPFVFMGTVFAGLSCRRPGSVRALWGIPILFGLWSGGYTYYLNGHHWQSNAAFFKREVVLHGNIYYHSGLADTLHTAGDMRGAEAHYRLALMYFPGKAENYINYAALLCDTQRAKAALALLDKSAKLLVTTTSTARFHNNKGVALMQLGRVGQAVEQFELATAMEKGETEYWNNLGAAYGTLGRYQEAAKALRSGLAIDPGSLTLLRHLAITYIQSEAYPQALALLEKLSGTERKRMPGYARLLNLARSAGNDVN